MVEQFEVVRNRPQVSFTLLQRIPNFVNKNTQNVIERQVSAQSLSSGQ